MHNPFKSPNHTTLATKQLAEAQEHYLRTMLLLEHAEAQVVSFQAEAEYYAKSIKRLSQYTSGQVSKAIGTPVSK